MGNVTWSGNPAGKQTLWQLSCLIPSRKFEILSGLSLSCSDNIARVRLRGVSLISLQTNHRVPLPSRLLVGASLYISLILPSSQVHDFHRLVKDDVDTRRSRLTSGAEQLSWKPVAAHLLPAVWIGWE